MYCPYDIREIISYSTHPMYPSITIFLLFHYSSDRCIPLIPIFFSFSCSSCTYISLFPAPSPLSCIPAFQLFVNPHLLLKMKPLSLSASQTFPEFSFCSSIPSFQSHMNLRGLYQLNNTK